MNGIILVINVVVYYAVVRKRLISLMNPAPRPLQALSFVASQLATIRYNDTIM